jgi:hypothetical protein
LLMPPQLVLLSQYMRKLNKMPLNISSPPSPPQKRVLISSETKSGASISFTAVTIPAGYEFIEIFISAYLATAALLRVTFNADGGANYDNEIILNTNAVLSQPRTTGDVYGKLPQVSSGGFHTGYGIINNGATINKVMSYHGGDAYFVQQSSIQWKSNAEIASIEVFLSANTLAIGSKLMVFGVKA